MKLSGDTFAFSNMNHFQQQAKPRGNERELLRWLLDHLGFTRET